MDVRFYDADLSRLGDFPRPLSVNIQEVYCGYGSAEVHFSLNEAEVFEILEENELVFLCADGHWAVVTGWQVGEDIAVYGRTLAWLLTKRIAQPYSFADVTPEEAAIAIVQSAEDFVVTAECSYLGEKGTFESESPCTLYDGVCKALKPAGLGFLVEPDLGERKLVFRVYEGALRECLLSPSMHSACGMEYTLEKQDAVSGCGWYRRKIVYMGDWDAATNEPRLLNTQPENAFTCYKITSESYKQSGDMVERFGLWCQKDHYIVSDNDSGTWSAIWEEKPDTVWTYFDDCLKSGLCKWEALLSGTKTPTEVKDQLSALVPREVIDAEALKAKYGRDFRLGDKVRVQFEFGDIKRSQIKRVASVNVYFDVDKSGTRPTLEKLEE